MKVYKNDIYAFINKVEEKAVKFVQDELLETINIAKEDARFQGIIDDYNAFRAAAQVIENTSSKYSSFYNPDKKKFILRSVERPEMVVYKMTWKDVEIKGLNALLVAYISSYPNEYPEYDTILTYYEKVDGIKKEYSKLRRLIESTKSNNKCIEILKNLGYDVSSLIKESTKEKPLGLDTSKLLVCKEGEND